MTGSWTIRIATRGSPLARWQAEHVAASLRARDATVAVELVVVSTEGDRRRDVSLSQIGGKGVFVKEVQAALLDGRADVAVHSAKDLPAIGPDGIVVVAVPERADPRDGLAGAALADLAPGAAVATGSRRRAVQLLEVRPDLRVVDLRGNIDTRLARAHDADVDAVLVAVAALDRLGRRSALAEVLEPSVMLPQVGQGALAIECRADDPATQARLADLDDPVSHRRLDGERAFLRQLGGDCDLPAGAFVEADPEAGWRLRAVLADDGGLRRFDARGDDPVALGIEAASRLR